VRRQRLQFEILLPRDEDSKVLSYELYPDDAAFEAHLNGSSLVQFREEIAGIVTKLHGT
jgi:quinol monooxygenase YgiN